MPCPTTYELIQEHGVKVGHRCSCCGKPSLYEIRMKADTYYLCATCDVELGLKRVA